MKVEGKGVMEGCRLDLGVLDLDKGGPEFLGLADSAVEGKLHHLHLVVQYRCEDWN